MRRTLSSENTMPRHKLASPFHPNTLHERLVRNKAIDLRKNYVEIDLGRGYSRLEPVNRNKLIE